MNDRLKSLLWQSMGLYALFLIPTLLLLAYQGQSDTSISRQIGEAWQAGFWHFPGLTGTASRIAVDVLMALVVASLGFGFFQGWKAFASLREPLDASTQAGLERSVLIWAAIGGLVLLAVIPFHSSDLYGYLNRGFQQSLYHTNPYLTPVVYIPGWEREPMFHPHWVYNPCPYGFFFAQLVAGITALCGRHFAVAFLVFKAINLLLLLGTTWLILQLGRILRLQRPWLAAYAFGANPLVLLHVMGNGHNDIWMVFLLMAALWKLCGKRDSWVAIPMVALSVLIKYASLLALPFVGLYFLLKKDWRALWLGSLVSLLLLGLTASPYVDPSQPWPWADMLDNAGKPQHSLADMLARLVYYPVKWAHGPAMDVMTAALRLLKPIFWGGFIVFYLRQLWLFSRSKGEFAAVMAETGMVMAVMVALVSSKFHPWYTVMFLPFLLLLPENNRWRQFGQTFALFQLAGFTIFQNLHVISPLLLTGLPLFLAYKNRSPFGPTEPEQA